MFALDAQSIAQTTPTGEAIARAVMAGWALGPVEHCVLLRRGFNQVYELRFASGQHAIARLCAEMPRGEPNIAYETTLLLHLRAQGMPVAAPLPAADGAFSVALALPEGARSLLLFDFLQATRRANRWWTSKPPAGAWPSCTPQHRTTAARQAATRWTCRCCSTHRSNACSPPLPWTQRWGASFLRWPMGCVRVLPRCPA